MEYVVKREKLAKWLYYLGFDYRKVKDRTGDQEYVFLFPKNEDLEIALQFYTDFKSKLKSS